MRKILIIMIVCFGVWILGTTEALAELSCEEKAKVEWQAKYRWCNGENDLGNPYGTPPKTLEESRKCKKEARIIYEHDLAKCREVNSTCEEKSLLKYREKMKYCEQLSPQECDLCILNARKVRENDLRKCKGGEVENKYKSRFGNKENCIKHVTKFLDKCYTRCETFKDSHPEYYKQCLKKCDFFKERDLGKCDTINE